MTITMTQEQLNATIAQAISAALAQAQVTPVQATTPAGPDEKTALFIREIEKLGLRKGVDVFLYTTVSKETKTGKKTTPITSLYAEMTKENANVQALENLGFKVGKAFSPANVKLKRTTKDLQVAYLNDFIVK